MTGLCTTSGFRPGLKGVPDYNYVIEASTNLFNWVSLVTNASPFQFTDTNRAGFRQRYYRGRRF